MTVLGTCAHCGDVRLTMREVTVRVCLPTDERQCTFACPICERGCSTGLCAHVSRWLVNAGVKLVFWRWPLEMCEPHGGPRFTQDDEDELRALLADDGWLQRLGAR